MPLLLLHTHINASANVCFDLSRSIGMHTISTQQTQERAVRGVVAGLIEVDETVTWEAVHFGVKQQLSTRITAFERPSFFVDEMVQGAFKRFRHEHRFEELPDQSTRVTESFDYTSPLGPLGRLADCLFLKKYMTQLLTARNRVIKEVAESGQWQEILAIEKRVLL